mgnify:CR=1 FL=1
MEIERTPDSAFDNLPGFDYEPRYRDWNGMRLAYVDEGEGEPVLLLHGEPTWGFLWRKVMGPLLEAGYRCVVPDLPGFGRSDKPTDISWFNFDRMAESVYTLVDELGLEKTTLVCHDWGGPIGLRVATVDRPEKFSRLVAMNTGIFTGYQKMSDDWNHFRDFIASHEDVRIAMPIQGGAGTELSDEVVAAYEAPFASVASKASVRAMPPMIPMTPDAPGAAAGQATGAYLLTDTRPSLLLWGDKDLALPLDPVGRAVQKLFPTAAPLTVLEGGGHFVQEDMGEFIGEEIAKFLAANPV